MIGAHMTDFSYLERLNTKEKTAEYQLWQLEDAPILILAPATEANKPYYNQLLRKSSKAVRRMQSSGIDAGMLEKQRNDDKELFPLHVVKGWCGIKDANKKLVTFDKEAAKDFINALPNWIFDEVRNFAANPSNFIDDMINTEEVAGN